MKTQILASNRSWFVQPWINVTMPILAALTIMWWLLTILGGSPCKYAGNVPELDSHSPNAVNFGPVMLWFWHIMVCLQGWRWTLSGILRRGRRMILFRTCWMPFMRCWPWWRILSRTGALWWGRIMLRSVGWRWWMTLSGSTGWMLPRSMGWWGMTWLRTIWLLSTPVPFLIRTRYGNRGIWGITRCSRGHGVYVITRACWRGLFIPIPFLIRARYGNRSIWWVTGCSRGHVATAIMRACWWGSIIISGRVLIRAWQGNRSIWGVTRCSRGHVATAIMRTCWWGSIIISSRVLIRARQWNRSIWGITRCSRGHVATAIMRTCWWRWSVGVTAPGVTRVAGSWWWWSRGRVDYGCVET